MSEQYSTIGFIGAGKMAYAICAGLCKHGYPTEQLKVAAPHQVHLQAFAADYAITTLTDNRALVASSELLVLAVKPQVVPEVLKEIKPLVKPSQHVLVSIAAGLDSDKITQQLGIELPIVRVMPNTPALVQQSTSVLYANELMSEPQRVQIERIFDAVGQCDWIEDEMLMHAVTAVSGSGPAYYFYLLEQLLENIDEHSLDEYLNLLESPNELSVVSRCIGQFVQSHQLAAQQVGLSEKFAKRLVESTVHGSVALLKNELSGQQQSALQTIQTLRTNVTSKGGTTQAGLAVLQAAAWKSILSDGSIEIIDKIMCETIKAAWQRSQQLAA